MSVIERTLEKLRTNPQAQPATAAVASTRRPDGAAATPRGSLVEPKVFIDREALRSAGYLPESSQDRQFADEYRHIKRPLIAAAFGPGTSVAAGSPRLIMMASALPGDGKTFTSINLALSMAREQDTSVLLVDADVAKPHVSQIFGVEKERGLLDALADALVPAESLVLPTDVRGLSILPAGAPRATATELLASVRMSVLAEELLACDPGRIVLFDTSPLLVSSESKAVADIAGQVVLVVRAGKTPRRAIQDALAVFDEEKSVALVLNQGRPGLMGGGYAYGGYGSYGQANGI